MLGVTTSVIQDKRIQKKDGTFSVKLRITFNREQKYYPVNVSLTEEDWDKSQSFKARGEHKELQSFFNKIEQKAIEIIKSLDSFSFQAFDKAFNQKTDRSKDVFYYLENYMEQLKNESRSGTENSYKCAYNSFKSYLKSKGRKNFNFADLTPEWLQSYENWMVGNGKSLTSTGIYLRSLRTIVNIAVEDGVMSREFYPFGKRKYTIPAGRNVKKALTIQEIKAIVNYKTKTDAEQKAKDIWMLSYLCNGANMKDIALLKWKDIDSKRIVFVRAKTARTTKQDTKPVVVMLLPEIKEIILKWGLESKNPDDYIFGIVSQRDNSEDILKKVRQFIKTTNKYMKRIGTALELDLTLTSYSARHSFATVLKRSGAPIEFISESLGHKDLRTTENYLGSFEDDIKESYQKQLLNFD
ncbi:MAG: site-specific integrase [Cytophagaceae bacterium]|nr:site-specific integrase [Cytophagaceae bacterium]